MLFLCLGPPYPSARWEGASSQRKGSALAEPLTRSEEGGRPSPQRGREQRDPQGPSSFALWGTQAQTRFKAASRVPTHRSNHRRAARRLLLHGPGPLWALGPPTRRVHAAGGFPAPPAPPALPAVWRRFRPPAL